MPVFDANEINRDSGKLFVFSMFFTGTILYYSYQASLISALAIPIEKVPFSDPEGVLNTDYR